MCFSAQANFIGSAVIAGIGVATLTRVRHPKELAFAALPLLFAAHQFAEGFVWLRLDGDASRATGRIAATAYVVYAQAILPTLFPLAIFLLEPGGHRRRLLAPFLAIGVVVSVYLGYVLAVDPVVVRAEGRSVAYQTGISDGGLWAVLYVLAVIGPALLSGYPTVIAFGVANAVGLGLVAIFLSQTFTSVWCAYAAVLSSLILWHFIRRRHLVDEERLRWHPHLRAGPA